MRRWPGSAAAASAILRDHAEVAGIGGFSGRESGVSVTWLAAEVKAGKIRWVLDQESPGGAGFGGGGLPGRSDMRAGSRAAIAAAAKACQKVTMAGSAAGSTAGESSSSGTLYDCRGRASELAAQAARASS
jgi:hypothetical protein